MAEAAGKLKGKKIKNDDGEVLMSAIDIDFFKARKATI